MRGKLSGFELSSERKTCNEAKSSLNTISDAAAKGSINECTFFALNSQFDAQSLM
jgi:hypothetical protein